MSIRALDLSSLGSTRMNDDPWPWAFYEGVFQPHVLNANFPNDHFACHSQHRLLEALGRRQSDSWFQHNVETGALLELGSDEPFEPDGLEDIWLEVAADLLSPDYRDRLMDTLNYC
ncbi:MAG: hypothetical protein P8015_09670 [Acidihalobacter sp.]